MLSNLFAPNAPASKTPAEIVGALKGHYEPKPIVISERFNFHHRQQGKTETVAQYVAELRKLSVHCQFGAYLEEALRDRFVCGLRSEAVQKKLLTKEDLTFTDAIHIAQASEQAVAKARQLQSLGTAAPEAPLIVGKLSPQQSETYRCGKADHTAAVCRFRTARCHNCNKIGHIAAVCRQKKSQTSPSRSTQRKRKSQGIRSVQEEESESSEEDVGLKTIRCEQGKPMDLYLNGKPLTMELDTGAAFSLVSTKVLENLLPESELRPATTQLRTYSGERIEVLGQVEVDVGYATQQATLPLYVVNGTGPSLFGRNWLDRPEWESIRSVQASDVSLD